MSTKFDDLSSNDLLRDFLLVSGAVAVSEGISQMIPSDLNPVFLIVAGVILVQLAVQSKNKKKRK